MGCGLKNGYGCGSCGDCNGNYGAIASGFVLVPDNFNSVTNFVPKNPAYSALVVCGKAVENTGNHHGKRSKKCCETGSFEGKDTCGVNGGCGDGLCENMGFGANNVFPEDIRPDSVTVYGKVKCTCTKGMLNMDGTCGGNCGRYNDASEQSMGYVSWPPIGYVRSVRACGPIIQKACCKKHGRKDCGKCKVLKCMSSSSSSSSSSSKTSSFSSTSWSSSSSHKSHRHDHHHSHKSSSSSSACGACGH